MIGQVRVGDWDAYTSPLEIADLVEMDSLLVSATNGGLLVYDRDLDDFTTYNEYWLYWVSTSRYYCWVLSY